MKFNRDKLLQQYQLLRTERIEWEQEWKDLSDYLLPGRGVFQLYSKPRKRKLSSDEIVNAVATDALGVLTSGIQGGLTSPSRKWFLLEWADKKIEKIRPLVVWMQDCEAKLHTALHASNFYPMIHSFYTEFAGFGTGCMYVGEDTDHTPFRFELLTVGEYVIARNSTGQVDTIFRTIFMTPRQAYELFGKKCSDTTKRIVEENQPEQDSTYLTILEAVLPQKYKHFDFTRVYYEITHQSGGKYSYTHNTQDDPLKIEGFYEFPYPAAPWDIIGSDVYGIGPGSKVLPDIKRLQEMEKGFLMAAHKNINPPLNAPARMKGKLNTFPGGYNYYSNPNEVISEIYNVRFDYQGVMAAIEAVSQRIQRGFYNDIFLSANRDPNASPYKAEEVRKRDAEAMLRLGPVIERLQQGFLQPLLQRCFNIMLRKELFEPFPMEYQDLISEFNINLIGPLAQAQKALELNSLQTFYMGVGQIAQIDPRVLDNINNDESIHELADITGIKKTILNAPEVVRRTREQRAQQQAAMQQEAMRQTTEKHEAEMGTQDATSLEARTRAGLNVIEGGARVLETGGV